MANKSKPEPNRSDALPKTPQAKATSSLEETKRDVLANKPVSGRIFLDRLRESLAEIDAKDSLSDAERERYRRWVTITDAEWAEISKASGLPEEARKRVETLIVIYRNGIDFHAVPPGETRDQLRRCATNIKKVMEDFVDILEHNVTTWDLLTGNDGWSSLRLDNFVVEAARFLILLESAAARVGHARFGHARTGPDKSLRQQLVNALADVWVEYKNEEISLANNMIQFMALTCRIVEPTMTDAAVRNDIRKVRNLRLKQRQINQ